MGVGERLIRFRVVLVQVSSRGRRTRRARDCAGLRCCSAKLMLSPDAGALELGTETSQRQGGERWALRRLWGLPRLSTSPRLMGNWKHAQQRPERGLATHTHLRTEERKEARGGEGSLKSDCPSIHTHHQQGRELTAPSA